MNELAKCIGLRIRNHRMHLKLSQEKLAELSGCHPTISVNLSEEKRMQH